VLLSIVLVALQLKKDMPGVALWGLSLLLIVWASLRQGLRGGALAALSGSFPVLVLASFLGISPSEFSPLQGDLLAQWSTALLAGASAGWIRASEARYRQVVGHIPLVLYSARLPRGFALQPSTRGTSPQKRETSTGEWISHQAEITLVSSASRQVFGTEA